MVDSKDEEHGVNERYIWDVLTYSEHCKLRFFHDVSSADLLNTSP